MEDYHTDLVARDIDMDENEADFPLTSTPIESSGSVHSSTPREDVYSEAVNTGEHDEEDATGQLALREGTCSLHLPEPYTG